MGEPFVGPAGQLLDRALEEAGVDPRSVFRTNAVKHFRFSGTRGKQRIHKTPSRWHVTACGPWLLAELEVVRPRVVVVLGPPQGRRSSVRRSGSASRAAGGWTGLGTGLR